MSASVHGARFGIGIGVGGADERVQFTEYGYLGAGNSRINLGRKAGDVSCGGDGVTQLFKGRSQISVSFPFLVTGFGILPNIIHGIQNELTVFFYVGDIMLHRGTSVYFKS